MNKLYLFLIQFLGYLWHLVLFVVIVPYLLITLSSGLDFYLLNTFLGINPAVWFQVFPTEALNLAAFVVIALGLVVVFESAITLYQKAHAFPFTSIPHEALTPKELAISGWYARVRHPMLLGYLIALIGLGIYVHSISMMLWWIPLLGVVLLEYMILTEEKQLLSWFGEEYENYRSTVPALIPRLKRPAKSESDSTGKSTDPTSD